MSHHDLLQCVRDLEAGMLALQASVAAFAAAIQSLAGASATLPATRPAVPSKDGGTKSPSPWLSRKQAADYCGVSLATLEKWAVVGNGPPYREPRNRMIRYNKNELEAWLQQNKRLHTADDGSAERLLAEAEALTRKRRHW